MSTIKLIIGLVLAGMSGIVQAQSLDDYLVNAAENNPGLKSKYAEFEAAMERITQAKALPDPALSFGYFLSPVETRVGPQRAKFGLSQMFPWFGTLSTKGEVMTLLAEAKYQEFLNAKYELFYKVKAAWYPLYEVHTILEFHKQNREILSTYKQLSTTAFKNGKSAMVDVIRVDIMLENSDTEIELLEDQKRPLISRFNNLLNRADTMSVLIGEQLAVLNIDARYRRDSLLEANPVLNALDLKVKSAEAREELAYKEGLPKFGIGLDYVIVEEGQMDVIENGKDAFMPMVSLSLPIFRNKYRASVKEAQYAQMAIALFKEDYENTLISSYDMTVYEMERAAQLISLYQEQTTKTDQAITLLLQAYSNSGQDFEEVLRMQQDLLKYQIAETKALNEYYTALAKLDYLTAKSE